MTRKRYVKLLMGLGVQRNQANARAYLCQVAGVTYEADYRRNRIGLQLARAARQVGATILNMAKELKHAVTAVQKLKDSLAVHHPQPITPENLTPGNMLIVTKQEHDALHGYSAKVSFADELETAGGGQA